MLHCSVNGCNKKYISEKKWLLHMEKTHQKTNQVIPPRIEKTEKSEKPLKFNKKIKIPEIFLNKNINEFMKLNGFSILDQVHKLENMEVIY